MEELICQECGKKNDAKKMFCTNCGKILTSEIDNEKLQSAQFKLTRILANLKEHPHHEILWNSMVDSYTKQIEKIQSIAKIQDIGIDSSMLIEKIEVFLDNCRNSDFEIALVGAVKAGKSTMINALLGRNYASTDPNPETAVLTKFRSSEEDYVKVKFYSEQEWEKLWNSVQQDAEKFLELYKELEADKHKAQWVGHAEKVIKLQNNQIEDELKRWSTSHSPVHFFVKEIEVGISSLPVEFPKQVVFVDTPGLFDPVAFRSQISIDYIQHANAVLVCVKAEDLHGEEVKTLESVFSFSGHKREKVYIIATNWDKLNDLVDDWNKRYEYMVDSFTGKAFFPTKGLARKNILYVSSYHYNLCRDYKQLKKSHQSEVDIFFIKLKTALANCMDKRLEVPDNLKKIEDIVMGAYSQEDLINMMELTNVPTIKKTIVEEFVDKYKEILYRDIEKRYDDIMKLVARIAVERKAELEDRITISAEDMRQIEAKLEEAKKLRDNIQKVQKQLDAAVVKLDKSSTKRMKEIFDIIGQV